MTVFTSLLDVDKSLLLFLNDDWGAVWDSIFWYLSRSWIWTPLYILMAVLLFRNQGWRGALVAIALITLAMVLADHTANFFKDNIPKFRPTHDPEIKAFVHTVRGYTGAAYGTVSSHAATTTGIAVASAGIIRRRWWSVLMIFYVGLTCFSRIYLGAHFPMDILCGLAVGTLWGFVMRWLWRFVNRKWSAKLHPAKETEITKTI